MGKPAPTAFEGIDLSLNRIKYLLNRHAFKLAYPIYKDI